MRKNLEESHLQPFRLGRTANTRLVRSSQMPKDFFSGQRSSKALPKTCSSEVYSSLDDKHIFEQFKSMFRMRRNLQSLALKLNPKLDYLEEPEPSLLAGADKENMSFRLPSLYLHAKHQDEGKSLLRKSHHKPLLKG